MSDPRYKTRRWQKLRLAHLRSEPLCRKCAVLDKVTAANTVDHITPHRGDDRLFWDRENLQALCPTCHSAIKQREEARGFSDVLDADGWPADARHPANAGGERA